MFDYTWKELGKINVTELLRIQYSNSCEYVAENYGEIYIDSLPDQQRYSPDQDTSLETISIDDNLDAASEDAKNKHESSVSSIKDVMVDVPRLEKEYVDRLYRVFIYSIFKPKFKIVGDYVPICTSLKFRTTMG